MRRAAAGEDGCGVFAGGLGRGGWNFLGGGGKGPADCDDAAEGVREGEGGGEGEGAALGVAEEVDLGRVVGVGAEEGVGDYLVGDGLEGVWERVGELGDEELDGIVEDMFFWLFLLWLQGNRMVIFSHLIPYHLHTLRKAGIIFHLPSPLIKDDVIAPMESAEVKWQRCRCLHCNAYCVGKTKLSC